MVRILSCHHFRGQRIGRCEEAVGVAVAGDAVLVALENQINVYGRLAHPDSPDHVPPPHPFPGPSTSPPVRQPPPVHQTSAAAAMASPVAGAKGGIKQEPSPAVVNELGRPFQFPTSAGESSLKNAAANVSSPGSGSVESVSLDSDTDLKMSHSFATVDSVHSFSYNEAGKFVLCLEKREASPHHSTSSVRSYFCWEKNHGSKPLRARIAGLVSPTGSELDMQDCLMMIEIPLTSPATAVASCNLTGNIACLSAESIINLFLFRVKEGSGRAKVPYHDFDRTYAIEMPGFVPESLKFVANYFVCMNSQKIQVFRVKQEEGFLTGKKLPTQISIEKSSRENHTQKVVYDPKNESVKVHLTSILRANRRRKYPDSLVVDDLMNEITTNHTKVVFSAVSPRIIVEDVLRLGLSSTGNHSRFVGVRAYPIRLKDGLGAVALMVCTVKEGYLYHLPCVPSGSVARVANYSFTAPLLSFAFDSLFFHALTETGLESYTVRSLYNAVKDVEGINLFRNECPFNDEPPSLIGIRPFVNVKAMSCNSSILCMLASPNSHTAQHHSKDASQAHEEPSCTIYTLDLPDIHMVYDDMFRTAKLQEETNCEAHLTLLCEVYVVLKLFMESHPEAMDGCKSQHKEICKQIGLTYLQSCAVDNTSTTLGESDSDAAPAESTSSVSEPSSTSTMRIPSEVMDKGVTYLLMGRYGVQEVFSPENWAWMRDPKYIPGLVRMIEVTFLGNEAEAVSTANQKLSPTLAPVVVEFLSNNGPNVLVELVIRTPFIRECNTKRLLQTLQQLCENSGHAPKETLGVLLTLVTVGGSDANTREQVKDLLKKTDREALKLLLTKEALLEARAQQTFLTDLAICIIAANEQQIVADRIGVWLQSKEISISLVMLAFTQALNVNTESSLQHCISKCLTSITEQYVAEKMKTQDVFVYPSEEDHHSLQLLTRTYVSNITIFRTNSSPPSSPRSSSPPSSPRSSSPPRKEKEKASKISDAGHSGLNDFFRTCQIFGNVSSCVNFLLSINTPGGFLTPTSQNLATTAVLGNEESRENFIKLMSLLSNPILANLNGIKDIVLTYLYKNTLQTKPAENSTLYLTLQIMAESPEKAVNLLLTKQPTTIMLFAKEIFQRAPEKWKALVQNLKGKLQRSDATNTAEVEIYATILESVFLHLANNLSPAELERVLDKETEESQKFHGICKRVELANNYANMVITVSKEYLNHK